eukprot:400537-Prymnesium_polylepis.1
MAWALAVQCVPTHSTVRWRPAYPVSWFPANRTGKPSASPGGRLSHVGRSDVSKVGRTLIYTST